MATARGSKAQANEAGAKPVETAEELEVKAASEGDVQNRVEADDRQAEAEAKADDKVEAGDSVEGDKAGSPDDDSKLVKEAYDLKDDAVRRSEQHFDPSNLIKQRAVFDTSGNGGLADQDMRRAYPAYDVDSLVRDDVPEHLAKYVVSDEGAPAILKREEKAREDAPSTKKSKQ